MWAFRWKDCSLCQSCTGKGCIQANIIRPPQKTTQSFCRAAISIQLLLKIHRVDQAQEQLKVACKAAISLREHAILEDRRRKFSFFSFLEETHTFQLAFSTKVKHASGEAILDPACLHVRPRMGVFQFQKEVTSSEAYLSRSISVQAMVSLDEDSTLTQLATAWIGIDLVRLFIACCHL